MAKPALMSGALGYASTVYRGGGLSGVGLRSWPFSFGLGEMNIVGGVFWCADLVWSISLLSFKAVGRH